jgi:4a-hydroxytetrahydrobiopterin dehydratase
MGGSTRTENNRTRSRVLTKNKPMNIWKDSSQSLEKTYTFISFELAMSFMQQAALKIISLDHHPTWTNTYNRVHVVLTTHDAGNQVTQKDRDLAEILDSIYLNF